MREVPRLLAPVRELAGRVPPALLAGSFAIGLSLLLCGCGSPAVPRFRLAGTDRGEVIVREFDSGDVAVRPLGGTVARTVAEILQNRGILAPIVAADEWLPRDAHALIEGQISCGGRGTLIADARLVDLDRDKVLLEHRFRERANTFFGEEHALHRDAREIGRAIADWATAKRD